MAAGNGDRIAGILEEAFDYRQLRAACRRRELSAAGTKGDLIRRLTARGGVTGSEGVGYEIAVSSRTRRAFGVVAGLVASADRHMSKTTLGQLREICRMHDRGSALFSGMIDRAIDNVFGSDFDFIPNSGDRELDKIIKRYIKGRQTAENASASCEESFPDLAKLALRAVWTDGDQLLVKKPNGRLLPFEADQIETPGAAGLGGGAERIVLGVRLDNDNRHLGYYVRLRHSRGDTGYIRPDAPSQFVKRVDAIFPAYRKRQNQTRGIPFLAAALAFYDRTHNWLDYESLAAEGNSMLGWKITKEHSVNDLAGAAANEDDETNSTFEQVQKMEPLQVFELRPGEDVQMIGAERPGSNFEPYLITCCRVIGVAIGMPLELVMMDFSRTNYSSARASLGEARRSFRVWQKFADERICRPWYAWQIARGIAAGELPAKDTLFDFRCQWPAWEYIDPAKSAAGNDLDMRNLIKTPQECIREQGKEPLEVLDEWQVWNKELEERGLKRPEPAAKTASKGRDDSDWEDREQRKEQEDD